MEAELGDVEGVVAKMPIFLHNFFFGDPKNTFVCFRWQGTNNCMIEVCIHSGACKTTPRITRKTNVVKENSTIWSYWFQK